jgi:TolA-binding protein
MLRNVIIFFALIVAAMMALHTTLQNGSFLKYLDEHPDPRYVPQVEYYIGGGYYMFHDLQNAATYYIRVPERYPASPYSDDAYFEYLQCLDDSMAVSRADMVGYYAKYLERFPNGNHATVVQNRMDDYRTGAR